MNYSKFLNTIRTQATIANSARSMTDLGRVTAYDPQNYLVTVEIYPEDGDTPSLQTGWIPLFTPWMGAGWGLYLPPNIGDIIEVHYQAGSLQNAYAGLRSFNFNANATPNSVQSGEFWLVHQSGSFIKLTNDGNLSISSSTQINVTAPIVNVDSEQVNLGNGSVQALLNAAAATIYNEHTHASPSAPPVPLMTATEQTTNTQAS